MRRRQALGVVSLSLALVVLGGLSGGCNTITYPLPTRSEADAIETRIKGRLGPVLESVAVTPTRFTGVRDDGGNDIVGFKVVYRLRDCPTAVSNLTQLGDWFVSKYMLPSRGMSPETFKRLLCAYAAVSRRPAGTIAPCGPVGGESEPPEARRVRRADGGEYWLVTEGFDSVDQIRPRPPSRAPGFVFFISRDGSVEFVARLESYWSDSDIGD